MGWFRRQLQLLAHRLERRLTVWRTIHGMRVAVFNSRPNNFDREQLFERVDAVLKLLATHQPWRLRHLQRDVSFIWVRRYICRGAYLPDHRACLLELSFLANRDFNDAQIAATLIHEAMHARVHRAGVRQRAGDEARIERICRRAELAFGEVVPGGGPVIERALEALALQDDEVAPVIDWAKAQSRVTAADLRALGAPAWIRRAAASWQGIDPASVE